jgi:quercetin dioxygenase-like cupin family protein
MTDIQTLRAYAKGRSLPGVIYLGNVSDDWIETVLEFSKSIPDNIDYSISNRTDIPGEHDYSLLNGNYTQKNVLGDMVLDKIFDKFEDIYNIRFAILKPNQEVPTHLDSPYAYRLICVLEGSHDYIFDNKKIEMTKAQLYFVNGCIKHSVKNNNSYDRIAILAKMPITEKNTNELLRTRT